MSGEERLFSSTSNIYFPCYGKEYGEYEDCADCIFSLWCWQLTEQKEEE